MNHKVRTKEEEERTYQASSATLDELLDDDGLAPDDELSLMFLNNRLGGGPSPLSTNEKLRFVQWINVKAGKDAIYRWTLGMFDEERRIDERVEQFAELIANGALRENIDEANALLAKREEPFRLRVVDGIIVAELGD